MIIWGFRSTVQRLASLLLVCPGCRGTYATTLNKGVTKFTLFFIPLFPTSTRYALTCTWCGTTSPITKEMAEQLQAQAQQGLQA
ncbi:zinc-ribbon domain-containing protein [Saccharopolyspora sp. NPDC003752]|uniref:zinc-ribbon domain-containing protein n=1 Tax=Saccharopolyspora sp. NPDC050642 TaxID=3157099 RepID=UPI0033C83057